MQDGNFSQQTNYTFSKTQRKNITNKMMSMLHRGKLKKVLILKMSVVVQLWKSKDLCNVMYGYALSLSNDLMPRLID